MSLTPGNRIGPYEVIGSLGAGGMGEVYRARDVALGRDVAIKILPDHFSSDADRLARFEREARTLASLNHPGIAHIYGMESAATSGHRVLVMELVEGEDLSAMIARGRLPLADAMSIAKQIAEALEAAHDTGVIHRDLKPANIKVRDDGTVKVLDFGLAKTTDPSGASSANLAHSPTITSPATQFGTLLGTAAYMSPEQARGKVVDRRADVWAFGVILYEMLSGRRAFGTGELSDVLAAVLKDTVPLEALPADTPAAIRRLLRRCLEKNRADRLDSMATARLEISDAMSAKTEDIDRAPARIAPPARARIAIYAALLAAGAILGVVAGWPFGRSASAAADRVVRFSTALPSGAELEGVAITDAGESIVYQTDRLYVRPLADGAPRALPGTEGARMPFLSPDGRWVGFYAGGQIRKIGLAGGDPLAIADVNNDAPGAAWGPNDTIIFTPGWHAPLYSVPADGGAKPVAVSTVDIASGELGHWWPHLMPDGNTILFTVWRAATGINDSRLAALDLDTGKHRVLMPGSNARYLLSGHLLYFQAGRYHVARFDPVRLEATGEPVHVIPDALPLNPAGGREKAVTVSRDGTLAYMAGPIVPDLTLAWMSSSATTESIAGSPRAWAGITLSPDGRRAAGTSIEGGNQVVWLRDLARGTDQRVDAPGANFHPIWSPAGDFLLFTSMRAGHFDAYRQGLDGRVSAVIEEPYDQEPAGVTHDGKLMVLWDYSADGSVRLMLTDIDQPKERKALQVLPETLRDLKISPDDKWLAVEDAASGRSEILVHPFPGTGAPVRVSTRGGTRPRWSRTGSHLYYQRDDELVSVTYAVVGGRLTIQREAPALRLGGRDLIDIAPDGRFLVSQRPPGQSITLQVVVNWFAELKQ